MLKYFFPAVFLTITFLGCFPETEYKRSGYLLEFSADTLSFDTVFSDTGTSSQFLKVYNNTDADVEIASVYLNGANTNRFELNIDGVATNFFENVRIRANDSLFIFIRAKLPSNGTDSVLFFSDEIIFEQADLKQEVKLIAWAEDAIFIDGEIIQSQTFTNEKPYVIFNSMMVDTGAVLTVEAGARLYFHHKSRLYVAGSLICNGTQDEPVVFMGDRLDYFLPDVKYDKLPGQWEGIWIMPESKANVLNHTIVANAIIGLQIGGLPGNTQPDIVVTNSVITNHTYASVFAINAQLSILNSEISNAGTYLAALVVGGKYESIHSTFANYYFFGAANESPVIISDNVIFNNEVYTKPLQQANFFNCIFYGMQANSVTLSAISDVNDLSYQFRYCLMRYDKQTAGFDTIGNMRFSNIIWNKDPKFVKHEMYSFNFEPDSISPVLDNASPEFSVILPTDMKGTWRIGNEKPDIGAYERKKKE